MATSSDVIVLGAGIIGVSVAGELARRGARVTLVDARQPGQGATQASAGMLAPFTEAELDTTLSALCIEALGRYDDVVTRVRRDSAMDFEYARTGTVEVALDAEHAATLRESVPDLLGRGVECRWDESSETLRREPALTQAALGSLVVATHGFVAVSPFLRALLAAARSYGVTLRPETSVERIAPLHSGLEVRTNRETLRGTQVVVCCGCWSGRIGVDGEPPQVHPVRGQLLELAPRTRGIARILWGPRCYLVPWSNGHLLVGATVEDVGFDERTTADGVATLLAAAIELAPVLRDATFVGARAGLRPASRDGLPVIGPASEMPGLVYATGHYRNGVLLAPLTAEIVGDLVLTGRPHPALASLSPARFGRAHAAGC